MLTPQQEAEIAKYSPCYRDPLYKMGDRRKTAATRLLETLQDRESLLDVATGRGELICVAKALGWKNVMGTEVVPELLSEEVVYGVAWDLPFPDGAFETVTFMDAMEHLLPQDAEPTVRELVRVARKRLVLAISNRSGSHNGVDLHVNRRPYEDWDADLRTWCQGWEVQRLPEFSTVVSECWVLTKLT